MSTSCKLCHLPLPKAVISDGNYRFCCYGCLGVFEAFGETALIDQKKQAKPESIKPKENESESYFRIDGMHCSSCEILIKKCAEKIAGISHVSTNYATSSARVIFDPAMIDESELPKKIGVSGYQAYSYKDKDFDQSIEDDKSLLRTLIISVLAGVVMMLNIAFFYPLDFGLVSEQEMMPVATMTFDVVPKIMLATTTLLIFVFGFPILRGAIVGLRSGALNMDNLLSIAILSAYAYSIGQIAIGTHNFYFDVSAMIVGVVSIGRYFEQGARTDATRELSNIIKSWHAPIVHRCTDGHTQDTTIAELKPHDHIIVKQGECIPVDGNIIKGQAAVDESLMTGETFPVDRKVDERVLGGATVVEGEIEIEIGETITSQIDNLADIFWNIQSSSSGSISIVDKISKIFVPAVLILSVAVVVSMLLSGTELTYALLAGMTTLIVSCPCTFGLATPFVTAASISHALKNKIIITSADIFAKNNQFSTVVIDKTGTLSSGKMKVIDVLGGAEVGHYAAAVEADCLHPVAKAIAKIDTNKEASDLLVHPGKGAVAKIDNKSVAVGSKALFALLGWKIPATISSNLTQYKAGDYVVSYVGWDAKILGAIVVQDQQRPEWTSVVQRLREAKHKVLLLTGSEQADGYQDYVDESYIGIPAEAKVAVIQKLIANGENVIMIGDGSNDAPALAAADLGIAFGTPTPLAIQAADVAIPGSNLSRIFTVLDLITTVKRRIKQNISWAFLYNAIAIPLALTGQLSPLFAAVAMTSSSLLVVWNSSRSMEGHHHD